MIWKRYKLSSRASLGMPPQSLSLCLFPTLRDADLSFVCVVKADLTIMAVSGMPPALVVEEMCKLLLQLPPAGTLMVEPSGVGGVGWWSGLTLGLSDIWD